MSEPRAKRKPNWTLCVNEASSIAGSKPRWREIGAAWESERGNLFVKLNAGEVLRETAMMFPFREKDGRSRPWQSVKAPVAAPASDYMERKRLERRNSGETPPVVIDGDPEAPPWLD